MDEGGWDARLEFRGDPLGDPFADAQARRRWGERSAALASAGVAERLSLAAVAKVARLARLHLDADELDRATHQLSDMLGHFADIDALDLGDVAPMSQPYPLVNVLRDDVVRPTLDRDEVMAAAPRSEGGRFWVPPILGNAG